MDIDSFKLAIGLKVGVKGKREIKNDPSTFSWNNRGVGSSIPWDGDLVVRAGPVQEIRSSVLIMIGLIRYGCGNVRKPRDLWVWASTERMQPKEQEPLVIWMVFKVFTKDENS